METIDIENFHDIKVELDFEDILDKTAKETEALLRTSSPKSNRPNRKTPYSRGWETKRYKTSDGKYVVVWNKTNWQLTHLLENGHFITNKVGRISWSAPKPHIRPAFDKERPKFIQKMKKVDIKVKIF